MISRLNGGTWAGQMTGPLGIAAKLLAVAIVAGCATGESLTEKGIEASATKPGMTRIVVYRDGVMGAAVQPEITVDSKPTGKCQPNGVFLVDVEPGVHRLTATTESTSAIDVDTKKYPVAYVKCSIGLGFFVGRPSLTQVPSEAGATETRDLAVIGTYAVP